MIANNFNNLPNAKLVKQKRGVIYEKKCKSSSVHM
jgi:hypothetical protein